MTCEFKITNSENCGILHVCRQQVLTWRSKGQGYKVGWYIRKVLLGGSWEPILNFNAILSILQKIRCMNKKTKKTRWHLCPTFAKRWRPGIFQGCVCGRISAPVPMEKWPVFSQKVDEISQSEAPQTFSNFSSLIYEYLWHSKTTISSLIVLHKKIQYRPGMGSITLKSNRLRLQLHGF